MKIWYDLFLGCEQTTDSAIIWVNSMALWPYFPRQITQAEAHYLWTQWFYEWFVPWLEWLRAQQF